MKEIKNKKRLIVSLISIVLVLMLCVGGTFAVLTHATETKKNHFFSGVANIATEENFTGGDIREETVTKEVRIKNSSENKQLKVTPVYIRVQLVAGWMDEEGNVMAVNAENLIDYDVNLNSTDDSGDYEDAKGDWVQGADGYYYFTGVVEEDTYTDILLKSVKAKDVKILPETGHLEVQVLADAVAAGGMAESWGLPCLPDGSKIAFHQKERMVL